MQGSVAVLLRAIQVKKHTFKSHHHLLEIALPFQSRDLDIVRALWLFTVCSSDTYLTAQVCVVCSHSNQGLCRWSNMRQFPFDSFYIINKNPQQQLRADKRSALIKRCALGPAVWYRGRSWEVLQHKQRVGIDSCDYPAVTAPNGRGPRSAEWITGAACECLLREDKERRLRGDGTLVKESTPSAASSKKLNSSGNIYFHKEWVKWKYSMRNENGLLRCSEKCSSY